MSDEYVDSDLYGAIEKVEWSSAMTPKDLLDRRGDGWILLSFTWDSHIDRFIYYFVRRTYFPL